MSSNISSRDKKIDSLVRNIHSTYKEDDCEGCKKYCYELLKLKPKDSRIYDCLLLISGKIACLELTSKILLTHLRIDPNNIEIITRLAQVLFVNKSYRLSIKYAKKALEQNPDNSFLLKIIVRGSFLIGNKNLYEKALKDYLKVNPTSITAMEWLGRFYLNGQNYLKSKKHFTSILELESDNKEAMLMLSRIDNARSSTEQFPRVLFFYVKPSYINQNDLLDLKQLPLGFNILMGLLKNQKIQSDITPINYSISTAEKLPIKLERKIKKSNANIIGISVFDDTLQAVTRLVELLKDDDVFIILGGPFITQQPIVSKAIFSSSKIMLLRGEVESTFTHVIKIFDNRPSKWQLTEEKRLLLSDVPGFYYKAENEEFSAYYEQDVYISPEDMDNVNFDLDLYFMYSDLPYTLNISSSRGCPRDCIFCFQHEGKQVRKMSAAKVVKIVDDYYGILGDKERDEKIITVNFVDNDFLINRHHVESTIELLLKRPYATKYYFQFQTSINTLKHRPQVIDDIVKLKNVKVTLGTDSFDNEELKRLNKHYDLNDVEQVLQKLETAKIRNYHYVILTNVDTTPLNLLNQLSTIIDFLKRYEYFYITLVNPFLQPKMNTKAHKRLEERGLLAQIEKEDITDDFYMAISERPLNSLVNNFVEQQEFPDFSEMSKDASISFFENLHLQFDDKMAEIAAIMLPA
jgi:radical SAM superfamily enzyme YgiQ (UPF0313 family)